MNPDPNPDHNRAVRWRDGFAEAGWSFEQHEGTPEQLHLLDFPQSERPLLRHCVAVSSALVLGSTQPASAVNASAAAELGIEVVKRRSGGGAVLVEPHDIVWIDLFVPAGHKLWQLDVNKATHWVGNLWLDVLGQLAPRVGREVHDGPMRRAEFAKSVCFAGLGPGEVKWGQAKSMGLAQRRTRSGALFQCSVYRRFSFDRVAALLGLPRDEVEMLRGCVEEIPDLDEAVLLDCFVELLSASTS